MRRWWAWLVQRFAAATEDEDADSRSLDIRAFRARHTLSDSAADANAANRVRGLPDSRDG